MKFVKVRYEGKAPYNDRTALKNAWEPGDVKLVSEADARALCRYLEFQRVTDDAKAKAEQKKAAAGKKSETEEQAELAQAQQAQQHAMANKKSNDSAIESALLEISIMEKDALESYARQNYSVDLDKRRSLETLRTQVTALVQGGVA